ncbi:chaperonin: PROVISIONAL [Gigaspora margarita]|uniref:Chaperonin: PROVISIONAL n=1 Tax=Gigaspora margarita TaxID=4874 RepID=A0A8H4AEK2_GIGMA|nr:chaperonin: PROVISIONAL [Gigaspora margarita]
MSLNENKENTFFPLHITLEQLGLDDYEDNDLDKKELDLVLMGQLMAFEYNQTSENENTKQKFNYQFNNNIKLCKNTYLKLNRVGNDYLIQVKKIYNYANVHRYPSPGQHLQHDTQSIIYLPTNQDYTKLDDHKQKAEIEREYNHNNNLTSTILPNTAYICYDWAQNVPVPYSPQQIGTSYFKSALQAHIFGICNTGQNSAQQLNYIIAENKFLQGTVTCDNCSAQNKNNLSLYFWCWLILIGMYNTIEIIMVTGHTKFTCDGYFGNIKTLFQKTIINTVDDVQKVINKLTKNGVNEGIRYNNRKVLCQTEAHGPYSVFNILKNKFNVNEVLDKISLKSLSKERQEYLYYEIRKYVDIKFQEITCPKLSWLN